MIPHVSKRKRETHIQGLINAIERTKFGDYHRKDMADFISDMSAKQLKDLVGLMQMHGMSLEILQKWVNTHKSARAEMTEADYQEVINYFEIKSVQND